MHNKNNKILNRYLPLFLILLLLFSAGAFVYYKKNTTEQIKPEKEDSTSAKFFKDAKSQETVPNFYIDPDFGFKFSHEPEISVSRFEEGEGIVLLLKNNNSAFAQIYITEFDEAGPVTPERIKKDLPDKEINEPGNINIGGGPALVFYSKDDSGLKVREYWFVEGGYLYRVTTEPKDDSLVQELLNTWE